MSNVAYHRFKSGYGQCSCLWCGRGSPHSERGNCRLDHDMRMALQIFARENGRTWKSKLLTLWDTGRDEGRLRQVRNTIGPSILLRLSTKMLLSYKPPETPA